MEGESLHCNTYSTCKTKAVKIQGHSQSFIRYWCLLGTKVSNHELSADGCHSSLKLCGVLNHQPRHKSPTGRASAGLGLLYARTSFLSLNSVAQDSFVSLAPGSSICSAQVGLFRSAWQSSVPWEMRDQGTGDLSGTCVTFFFFSFWKRFFSHCVFSTFFLCTTTVSGKFVGLIIYFSKQSHRKKPTPCRNAKFSISTH